MGVAIVRRVLRGTLSSLEQIFWGIVVGWLLVSAAGYVLARSWGRLSPSVVLVLTISSSLVVLLSLRDLRAITRFQLKEIWCREHLGLAIVLLIFIPIIWKVFSAHMLANGSDGVYSGGSSLYDLSFHATVASAFAYGANFPAIYTPLPPEPLLYPPLPDFHAAMLMTTGWSIRAAFFFTALPLAIAVIALLYSFAWRVSRSVRAAAIATLLFMFNGGFGFLYFIRNWRASDRSLLETLLWPPVNYCNDAVIGLHWVNVITDGLTPQRTTLYALPVALMIVTLFASSSDWFGSSSQKNEPPQIRLFVAAGLLTGTLCYLQPHVGIAIGMVAIGLCLLRPRRAWFFFFVTAALVSLPFLVNTIGHATTRGFMRFQPGWLGRDEPHQLVYWLRNLGLPLLLVIPAYIFASRVMRRLYVPFVIVMLVAVLFVLSPNDYDNLKLLSVWYVATSVMIATWLARMTLMKWLKPLVAVVVLVCVASGLLAVRRGMIEHELMFTNEQIQVVEFVRHQTAPRSLFLTAPVFQHPILGLAGRPIVRGPTDWLWSHGYNFQEREADVRRIYAGTPDAADLVRYYKIDYVYLGDSERSDLRADLSFFDAHYAAVYRSSSIAVYDTRGDRTSVALPEKPAPRELASRLEVDPYALLSEFSRTGFFAYRIIKASTGHMPAREQFMNVMKQLGSGVYIGLPGWEARLEANRNSLLNDWPRFGDFKTSFEGKSDAEFVEAISQNTARQVSKEDRDAFINRLNAGESRPSVLRDFVEDRGFCAREYNTAYVLMHFFGYLGRNPGDAPDHDLSGFNFWVANLDKTSDYRALSRAFLNSSEYQSRPIRQQ